MKPGDLVRIRFMIDIFSKTYGNWETGLLVKYDKTQKLGTILHKGKLIRLRGAQIQLLSRFPDEQD